MSGHSKWSTIKRAKAVTDARKGAIFTKIGNIIAITAREGGGDPNSNPSLRVAIEKARSVNMPKDNIERSIKRGTGELQGDIIEELYYEGILPNNIQFVIKCLTDNRNRSASLVRHALSKFGGSLGAVMWNFEKKGVIELNLEKSKKNNLNIDKLQLDLIDQNIEDFKIEENSVVIITQFDDLQKIKKNIEDQSIEIEAAAIEFLAKEKQILGEEDKEKIERFMEMLDDIEDVNDYYSNLDL